MSDMMTFPETWEEFEKSYGFNDSEEVYTNGSRLIPSFRVKQWLDHIAQDKTKRQATASSECIYRQAVIDAEGLDEQIRCEMCRNPMHTNRGCDGNCKYDEKLYERIMQILGERIKPLPSAEKAQLSGEDATFDCISRQDAIVNMAFAIWHYPNELYTSLNCFENCQELAERALNPMPSASTDLSTFSDKLWKIAYERGKAEGRKKGKWIEIMDADEFGEPYPCGVRCSECGFCSVNLDNFCPNCGAKMENDL